MECLYGGVPETVKNIFPAFKEMLANNLGLELKGRLDATGYTEIAQAALQKRALFLFGYDNGNNDLDDFLYPYFHSTGPKNSFMLSDPQLDEMLDGQRVEFDEARRQQLGYEIQRYLLDNVLARLEWVGDIARWARWPYWRNRLPQPWFGETFLLANRVVGLHRRDLPGPAGLRMGATTMEEPNYWTRWAKRRLSRRRLLKGAAGVGAGLAAASVVGCGGGDDGPRSHHEPQRNRRPAPAPP